MKRTLSFLSALLGLLFLTNNTMAQSSDVVEMADTLRSSGKIYVVVAVMCVVFIGIALYLFAIDRRLKRLEEQKS